MNDPRKEPGFKHKRHDDKVVMLLGAILDALLEPPTPPVVNAEAPVRRKREKQE